MAFWIEILELLKNIFDLEKCVFILAIDYDVVIKGLKPKFGELTDANEREFRSFFDICLQETKKQLLAFDTETRKAANYIVM